VVLGLTAAFTVFLTVVMQCYYDFGYNRNFKDVDKIYLLGLKHELFGWMFLTTLSELEDMKQTYPEIIDYCGIRSGYYFRCSITKEDGSTMEFVNDSQYGATESFPSFFKPKVIAGDIQRFAESDKVIITASYAKQIFGKTNPVGQTITMESWDEYNGKVMNRMPRVLIIAAVCEDFPDNCSLVNGIYYNVKSDPSDFKVENAFDYTAFINTTFPTRLDEIAKRRFEKMIAERGYNDGYENLQFFPLKTLHFSEAGTGNIIATLSLLFIGIVALVIAWINLINFSMAMAPSRVKSLNIQQIFGANTRLLRLMIASESAFFSLTAFLLAIFCANMIHKRLTKEFFYANLEINANLQVIIYTGIFIVLVGLILGLYPAYYATSFKPVASLSGSPLKTNRKSGLENILTIIQFTTAIVLIITAVTVKRQYSYAVNYSYGFDMENVIYVDATKLNLADRNVFGAELKNTPQILDCTSANFVPCSENFNLSDKKEYEDKEISFLSYIVQYNFMRFFGIPVIKGDDFTDIPTKHVIINEEYARQMADVNMIGRQIDWNDQIIGIAQNVNLTSLHKSISPVAFFKLGNDVSEFIFLKTLRSETKRTIAHIKSVWEKFSIEPVEVNFLDAQIAQLYKKEAITANMLTTITIIAIIIAIMGVYGLIALNIRKKEKEIALRKIYGASLSDILLLLNCGALIQLIIAFVVAAPVAYYITNRWLETFAYKISMHWWVFVLCWLFMCIITLATICMQTYRAATKNPVEAIKNE
jgi:putative ABC transport system permease protein